MAYSFLIIFNYSLLLQNKVFLLILLYKGFCNFLIVVERNRVIRCRVVGGLLVFNNLKEISLVEEIR